MIEAADSYISIELGIIVLADATYLATYRYLEGSKLARAHGLMEALAKEVNILIAILREENSLQDCKLLLGNFKSNNKSFKIRKGCCHATFRSSTRSKVWSRVFQKSSLRFQISFRLRRQQGTDILCHVPATAYFKPQQRLPHFCNLRYVSLVMTPSMASEDAGSASAALGVPISRLSADHFSIIVKFLEHEDIRTARLAGRELHFFLSPYLIKSVRFAPQGERLTFLEKLSQNHVFRQSVRILRFDTSLFELPLSTWNELDDSG
jgi:hypothetical protein